MSLAKLAEMVRYDNLQSFSKEFKKQFGISPKAYVAQLQSQLKGYVQSSVNRSSIPSEVCNFEGLELVYIRIFGKYGNAEFCEMAWNKLMSFLKENKALTPETRFIGLSFDDPNVTNESLC